VLLLYYSISNNSHRQIFGSLRRNIDEEDMVDPVVSTLDILKAQRARKAAARQQAAAESSVTESKSEPEAQHPQRVLPSSNQQSLNF
jgi:hypothetical protein